MEATTKFTYTAFNLARLLDEGETLDIGETGRHLDDGDALEWLVDRFPFPKIDLGLLWYQSSTDGDEVHQAYGPSKFGTTNNGIAYLLALCLEGVQQTARN